MIGFWARLARRKARQEAAIFAITRVCDIARWLDGHKMQHLGQHRRG